MPPCGRGEDSAPLSLCPSNNIFITRFFFNAFRSLSNASSI